MQQYGIGELDAALRIAEMIDRARGIEPLALHTDPDALTAPG
ncbi:hypothetical protein ACNQFN_06290 [Thauera butanivorans]